MNLNINVNVNIDNTLKINRVDASGLNDLKGLKKENTESEGTGIDWPKILR